MPRGRERWVVSENDSREDRINRARARGYGGSDVAFSPVENTVFSLSLSLCLPSCVSSSRLCDVPFVVPACVVLAALNPLPTGVHEGIGASRRRKEAKDEKHRKQGLRTIKVKEP